jgi:hypothetical protein
MTDTDIRSALERATDHLSTPPDLLDRVRSGGRRRVVRRRSVLLGGLGAVAAAVAVPVALGRRDDDAFQPAAHGDRAGDRRFVAEAKAAWRRAISGMAASGPALVVWAGTTPAGPAAWLRQTMEIEGGDMDVVGWVVTDGGDLRGSGNVQITRPGRPVTSALLLGEKRDVLVVADLGRGFDLSTDYAIDPGGKVQRTYSRVSSADWVFTRTVPPQRGAVRLAMIRAGMGEGIPLDNFSDVVTQTRNQVPDLFRRRLAGGTDPWEMPGGYDDPFGYHVLSEQGAWEINGATPDGRQFTVRTLPMDGTARVFWFLGGPDPHYAGLLQGGVLRVRLPGKQGVVVAVLNATLRYRTRGDWLPVGSDVALLPDAATELEVRPRGGDPATVKLP